MVGGLAGIRCFPSGHRCTSHSQAPWRLAIAHARPDGSFPTMAGCRQAARFQFFWEKIANGAVAISHRGPRDVDWQGLGRPQDVPTLLQDART